MDSRIRKATRDDAVYVANNIREADACEIRAAGLTVKEAVMLSYAGSDECFTAVINGSVALIFGVASSLFSDTASVWALGTDTCNEVPMSMVKVGREVVTHFLTRYKRLENYCDANHEKSLRWLKLLGFTIGDPEPWGPRGELFCKLSIEKE